MKPWLIAGIQRLVVPPRLVTGQVLQQVHTHIFVLRTDEPQPQQKGAEGERRIIPDGRFPELRVLLVDALRRDAIARMMLALTSPAWSVELNRRHSIVP